MFALLAAAVFQARFRPDLVRARWPALQRACAGFTLATVARWPDARVADLLAADGVIRNEKKLRATLRTPASWPRAAAPRAARWPTCAASAARTLVRERDGWAHYIGAPSVRAPWSCPPGPPPPRHRSRFGSPRHPPGSAMPASQIATLKQLFASRLDTLAHLLDVAERGWAEEDILQRRLAPDMFPFGAQVVLACNQPRGFAQWCAGQPVENLKAEVATFAQARQHVADTQALVAAIAVDDAKLDETKRIGLGPGAYAELPGHAYVADYLLPNLYFHLAIAYAILRHAGAQVGKSDFMRHLAPHVRRSDG